MPDVFIVPPFPSFVRKSIQVPEVETTQCPLKLRSKNSHLRLARTVRNFHLSHINSEVRDNWEANKAEFASKIATLLGETYSLEVDMNAIYPYAEDSSWAKTSPGGMTKGYFEGFVYQLERYLTEFGDDGKTTFNEAVSTKKIAFEVDDTGKIGYCGCDIKDGRFRILAGETYLGTNISDACYNMVKAVEAAEAKAGGGDLPVAAKANVKATIDAEFPSLIQQYSEILKADITLDANLVANYTMLKANKDFNPSNIGTVTLEYFKNFAYNLEYLKFRGDEMMQEGFIDACEKKTIKVEVVQKLVHGSYNDVIFEDGVCKLQVYPKLNVTDLLDGPGILVD